VNVLALAAIAVPRGGGASRMIRYNRFNIPWQSLI
jgi:hypothetical protein